MGGVGTGKGTARICQNHPLAIDPFKFSFSLPVKGIGAPTPACQTVNLLPLDSSQGRDKSVVMRPMLPCQLKQDPGDCARSHLSGKTRLLIIASSRDLGLNLALLREAADTINTKIFAIQKKSREE